LSSLGRGKRESWQQGGGEEELKEVVNEEGQEEQPEIDMGHVRKNGEGHGGAGGKGFLGPAKEGGDLVLWILKEAPGPESDGTVLQEEDCGGGEEEETEQRGGYLLPAWVKASPGKGCIDNEKDNPVVDGFEGGPHAPE
jgi:hypothetical protein